MTLLSDDQSGRGGQRRRGTVLQDIRPRHAPRLRDCLHIGLRGTTARRRRAALLARSCSDKEFRVPLPLHYALMRRDSP